MSHVKNQHYVPQFYLKYFADKQEQVFVFDKVARKSYISNVKNVANERYFYDINSSVLKKMEDNVYKDNPDEIVAKERKELIADLRQQLVEQSFSQFETSASQFMSKFLTHVKRFRAIRRKYKLKMSMLIATQYSRTPVFRNSVLEFQQKSQKALGDILLRIKGFDIYPDEYELAFDDNWASFEHLKMLSSNFIEMVASILQNHIWLLGINETSQPLYTSDNPVFKRGHIEHPYYSYEGLASKGIEIAFPLTSKYILIIRERTFFKELETFDCMAMRLSPEHVVYFNSQQVINCSRQIYSRQDLFDLPRKMCEEDPEISALKLEHWRVNSGVPRTRPKKAE